MSFQFGIGGRAAIVIGVEPHDPRILCDGCGEMRVVWTRRSRGYARWFLDGKAAPGWSGGRRGDNSREDWCPACTAARQELKDMTAQAIVDRINSGDLAGLGLPVNACPGTARVNEAGQVVIELNPSLRYADGRSAP